MPAKKRTTRTRTTRTPKRRSSGKSTKNLTERMRTMAEMDQRLGKAVMGASPENQRRIREAFQKYGADGFDAMPKDIQKLVLDIERTYKH